MMTAILHWVHLLLYDRARPYLFAIVMKNKDKQLCHQFLLKEMKPNRHFYHFDI
jgi:hypothetical protein